MTISNFFGDLNAFLKNIEQMHALVVEWLSVTETGADELDKQLTIEKSRLCFTTRNIATK